MAGINNGGGEYREYTWPVMSLFGLGLLVTLSNFWKTIAVRKTNEIYISNWYLVAALIFTITIAFVAYWPTWQNGLGETIIQGYYMHQGVGMWFMLFNLGLVYYFLPQQLNKPIYSYSLGVIAFWSQIFFYTVIGTHHFVFSSIPWWLQTVAIVGSVGMLIPVIAGTTNFFMSFKVKSGKELYFTFLCRRNYILFYWLHAGYCRSIPIYQSALAFYGFYCSSFSSNHVWYHHFFTVGLHLCHCTTING